MINRDDLNNLFGAIVNIHPYLSAYSDGYDDAQTPPYIYYEDSLPCRCNDCFYTYHRGYEQGIEDMVAKGILK